MNRTERQGRRTVRRIRLYTSKWLAITLRFLPRRSSTSLFVVSCVRRSALAHCRQRRKRNDESRGRNNKRRQKRNTKANPVFLLTILLRLITARKMSLAGKRFVSTENRTEYQVPAPSSIRKRNTLSREIERQKVTEDRLLVNLVMA